MTVLAILFIATAAQAAQAVPISDASYTASLKEARLTVPMPATLTVQPVTVATEAGSYLMDKVKANDVVMLGEYHRSRIEVSFFASMISGLAESGVENFAFEFLSSRQQGEINAFMDSSAYLGDRFRRREKIVDFLFGFRCVFTVFPYRDYVDAIENIYLLRHSSHPGTKLIGTGCNDQVYFGDEDDCLAGGSRDRYMAETLSQSQGKTVWYGGLHHSANLRHRTAGILRGISDKKVFALVSLNEEDDYISKLLKYPEIAGYLQEQLPTGSGMDVAWLEKEFDGVSPSGEQSHIKLSEVLGKFYDGFIYHAPSGDILRDQCRISDEYRQFIKNNIFDKLSQEEIREVVILCLSIGAPTDQQKAAIEKIHGESSPRNYLMKHLFNLMYDRAGKVFTDEDRRIFELAK
ncbi:MAG: hypothetical protein A2234_00240 [Elusimicrobia bacterium RIFOXYA2_FULL_58_8]|nr:MAG: hypothetical protein A2285_00880 [Elusimicrobia bacterium RIFOXYA12_FULL_57_11]OGS13239.1 MAG: hypothetical protein A2234_00240 [Elusimicrobia bacterium RIFOXYA2_FULL_58_8]